MSLLFDIHITVAASTRLSICRCSGELSDMRLLERRRGQQSTKSRTKNVVSCLPPLLVPHDANADYAVWSTAGIAMLLPIRYASARSCSCTADTMYCLFYMLPVMLCEMFNAISTICTPDCPTQCHTSNSHVVRRPIRPAFQDHHAHANSAAIAVLPIVASSLHPPPLCSSPPGTAYCSHVSSRHISGIQTAQPP